VPLANEDHFPGDGIFDSLATNTWVDDFLNFTPSAPAHSQMGALTGPNWHSPSVSKFASEHTKELAASLRRLYQWEN